LSEAVLAQFTDNGTILGEDPPLSPRLLIKCPLNNVWLVRLIPPLSVFCPSLFAVAIESPRG